jgi:hypothetical protein
MVSVAIATKKTAGAVFSAPASATRPPAAMNA